MSTQNNPTNVSSKNILHRWEYFWGEVSIVIQQQYPNRPANGDVRVGLLDGRRAATDNGLSTDVKAQCPSKTLIERDRGLFHFTLDRPNSFYNFVQARHIGFGDEVEATVTEIHPLGAELLLTHVGVVSRVKAMLSKSDYALNEDGALIVPEVGQLIKGLIVQAIDTRKKVVYVSLRSHARRIANVQQAFNKGTAVQIVAITQDSRDKSHCEFHLA